MKKRPGVKKSLAALLSLLMAAQTAVFTTAAEDSTDVTTENISVSAASADEPMANVANARAITGNLLDTSNSFGVSDAAPLFDGDDSTYTSVNGSVGISLSAPAQISGVKVNPRGAGTVLPNITVYEGTEGFESEGYDNLFDYDPRTKWCHNSGWSYVIWGYNEAIAISGYQFVTANDNAYYTDRNPKSWILYGSNNYNAETGEADWTQISAVTDDTVLENKNYTSFTFDLAETADEYMYYRCDFTETSGAAGIQLSGINLLSDTVSTYEAALYSETLGILTDAKIQGSNNGSSWATLYNLADHGYSENLETLNGITVTSDMMSYLATEKSFSYFRIYSEDRVFELSGLEFYGYENSDLPPYETTIGKAAAQGEYLTAESYIGSVDKPEILFDYDDGGYINADLDHSHSAGIVVSEPVQLTDVRITPRNQYGVGVELTPLYGVIGFSGESYDCLFDNDINTKWCTTSTYNLVVWEMGEAVDISGYVMVTANDNEEYPGRNPDEWILYGCNDYDWDTDLGSWEVLSHYDDSEIISDLNHVSYRFDVDEALPAYKYYQLEIMCDGADVDGSEVFQLAEFQLLYDGDRTMESTDSEDEYADSLEGLKIQGSSDGEEWITLYRFPQDDYKPYRYMITSDMFGSAASEYTFTQFRVMNDTRELQLAEVEFYGVSNAKLPQFPKAGEFSEPVFSYVDAEDILENELPEDEYDYVYGGSDYRGTLFTDEVVNPVAVIGGAGFPEGGYEYNPTTDKLGNPVVAIAPYAFSREYGITDLDIANDIRWVFRKAFDCTDTIDTVKIGGTLRYIEEETFGANKLSAFIWEGDELTDEEKDIRGGYYVDYIDGGIANRGIFICFPKRNYSYADKIYYVPDGIYRIAPLAFQDTFVGGVVMADSVREIERQAFAGSSIKSAELSWQTHYIGSEAFLKCNNLETLTVPNNVLDIKRNEGYPYDIFRTYDEELDQDTYDLPTHLTIYTYEGNELDLFVQEKKAEGIFVDDITVEYITETVWKTREESDGLYIIGLTAAEPIGELPAEIDGVPVVGIHSHNVSDGLRRNYRYGDENGNLVIPEGYRFIGYGSFEDGVNIKSVKLPESLQVIDANAFHGTSITSIVLPENVDDVRTDAFTNCPNLVSVVIKNEGNFNDATVLDMFLNIFDYEGDTTVPEITVVPNTAAHIFGIQANWRMKFAEGSLVSLLDLDTTVTIDSAEGEYSDLLFDGDTSNYVELGMRQDYAGIVLEEAAQLASVVVYPANLKGLSEAIPLGGVSPIAVEGYANLFDYDDTTKWCVTNYSEDTQAVWEMENPVSVTGYQVTTANDTASEPGRNPRSWTLYGSNDLEAWSEVHRVENAKLPEKNYVSTYFTLDEAAPEYKYYKLVIDSIEDGDVMQISEFALDYEGSRLSSTADNDLYMLDWIDGTKIQGSADGENWITLYRFPGKNSYAAAKHTITADMFGSAAKEYKFTHFRVMNDTMGLGIADVEFYAFPESDLPKFPTEITEPIYSYVDAWDILDVLTTNDHFYDYDYLWYNEIENAPYFYDEFENPVMIIGGVLPEGTVIDVEDLGGDEFQVVGFAPYAFALCDNVVKLEANENLRYICDNAFYGCGDLSEVVLNKYIRNIHEEAFIACFDFAKFTAGYDTPLTDEEKEAREGHYIEVRDGYAYRGDTLLRYPQILNKGGSFTVPDDIKYIGDYAFERSLLTSIDLGESVREIGRYAFWLAFPSDVTLSPVLEYIEYRAFYQALLKSVIIPASTTRIESYAFMECQYLTKVTILNGSDSFNEGSINYPYYQIFDIDAETGKSVAEIYLYEGSQAEEVAVLANWNYYYLEKEDTVKLTVGNAAAKAGGTVSVDVMLTENTGITGLAFEVSYDTSVLTLESVEREDALSGFTYVPEGDLSSPCKLTWNDDSMSNDTSTGVLVTLTFSVAENAAAGDSDIIITYDPDDVFKSNPDNASELINVALEAENGRIVIADFAFGDINGDGAVNGKDVTILARYIAGGYSIEVFDEAAADVNLDEKINGKDLTLIRRYVAGGFGIELGE